MKTEEQGWVCQGGIWVYKDKPADIVVVGFKPVVKAKEGNDVAATIIQPA